MRKLPIILLALIIFTMPCFAGEVPFTLEKGFIIVAAKIKKDIPVEAAISTGSPYSLLNPDLILRHKIQLGYTSDGPVTGRNDSIIHFANVPNVSVGDESPESLTMKQQSFKGMNQRIGREIGAILGVDFLKGRVLKIDFARKVLIFYDKSPHDYAKLKAGGAGATALVSDMDQSFRTFYGFELSLPVVNQTLYEGVKIRTLFETGNPLPVSLSPAAIKEHSIGLPVPDKGATRIAQLKSINLFGLEISDVPALLSGKDTGFDENLRQYGAIIGIAVLQNFKVTFDWKEKKVVLEQ